MRRILTALGAVPLLLLLILKGSAPLFLLVVLVTAVIGFWELSAMMGELGHRPFSVGYPFVAAVVATFYPGAPDFTSVAILLMVVVGLSALLFRSPAREGFASAAATVFGTVYVGLLIGSLVGIRAVEPEPLGRRWIIFLLAVVMIGDAGAYYVGTAFGRHRLAPVLSPKKSVEGLVGDITFSVATASVLRVYLFPSLSPLTAAGLGLVLSGVGVVGDLFESFLKRSAGVKDASSLIPGHGGILDRLDSLLFASPMLLLYLRWVAT
jgi:phosphatidate cytidylyltransferase